MIRKKRPKSKKGFFVRIAQIFAVLLFFVALGLLYDYLDFTDYHYRPIAPSPGSGFSYDIPLDPKSPWPKFRANCLQNGRSPVKPQASQGRPWKYSTGKGIFSSPVIDGQGNIYIGSGDHHFYSLTKQGRLRWKFRTQEIIDSAALLDNKGHVYFGSGDGHVYALERDSGKEIWRFEAHSPKQLQKKGINSFINWFEGNVAMGPGGNLLVPNDNFLLYSINRNTGQESWHTAVWDQIWSLPAVNPKTDRIFMGNNFFVYRNIHAFDYHTGQKVWGNGAWGSMVASPLLTNPHAHGLVVAGGFDGIVRAFDQKDGNEIWRFNARDHIYSSPAQLSDGTLIQPAADGTIYAINPETAKTLWKFDTQEPIRSSPAVDGQDRIYVGSGEGKLYSLNSDGTLRWSFACIKGKRNDLNSSPALGKENIVIAGESGEIFSIPYDYCLNPRGRRDERCRLGPGEQLPRQGEFLYTVSRFGNLQLTAPRSIKAHQPLTFFLLVRDKGDTLLTLLDKESLEITTNAKQAPSVNISADKKFITVIPNGKWTPPAGGELKLEIKGAYRVDPYRLGLKMFGADKGGSYRQTFRFKVAPYPSKNPPPIRTGQARGGNSVFELGRLAAPLPTILPSYNQIGFDSIHYLLGVVAQNKSPTKNNPSPSTYLIWGIGAKLDGRTGRVVVDPNQNIRFAMKMRYEGGLITLLSKEGFTLEFNGWDMPYKLFRVATQINPYTAKAEDSAALNAMIQTEEIDFYGPFLKVLGVSDFQTGLMHVFGGADFGKHSRISYSKDQIGKISLRLGHNRAEAFFTDSRLKTDEHNFGILLVNSQSGEPIPVNYTKLTQIHAQADGTIQKILLEVPHGAVDGQITAYVMVDTYPAYKKKLFTKE